MTIDIKETLIKITQRIVAGYKPERIVLFGSYAWGEPGPDSDVDLLIVKETTERALDRIVTVRRILHGLNSRCPMDILVMTPSELQKRRAIGDQFCEALFRDGVELYAA